MLKMRNAAIVAVAAASLSLPLMSTAQAGQDGKETPAARMPLKKQLAKRNIHNTTYNTTRTPATMTPNVDDSAYHGHFTLPEFAPDYHGSNGG